MCGFAALFAPGRGFPAPLLDAMDRDLFHRGPDSGGRAAEPGWAMVFRRLAIVDPQPASDQPMTDADGRCTLVFNGEIYNYRALRAELEAAGCRFVSGGDGEVILQGYRQWGEGVLDRLEGMYAFVLVDRRANAAVAARDPLGIKPLYLLRHGGVVGLASEMRPFLHLVPAEPDPDALAELLTFGWAAGRRSNLRHIDRVPGGTLLRIPLDGGPVAERRFCDPLTTLSSEGPGDGTADAEEVGAAVRASVAAHLMSDVGYTVELSGGIDSGVVGALARERTSGRLASFGIHLPGSAHDEGEYRRMVVERYGLEHREVAFTGGDFADAWPRAVRHMEGPVPHGGCVLIMRLCEASREVSKVALTGEGADEMFGGYARYADWRRLAWQERVGRLIPRALLPARPPFLGVRRLQGRDAAAYAGVYHDFRAMARLFPDLLPAPPGAREAASARFGDFRDRLFAVDQSCYLESLLVRQDKMSMAASVEARVPFVHLPLLRVANRLPRDIRAPGGTTKPVLKALADGLLPPALVHRRKVGLTLPYAEWLADEALLGRYLPLLTDGDGRLAAIGDGAAIRREVAAFRAGRRAGLASIFQLVNAELWLRSLPAGADLASAA